MTTSRQTGTMVVQPSPATSSGGPFGGLNSPLGFVRAEPWSEEAYFALGETPGRVELLDGSLLVSPPPTPQHQAACRTMAAIFDAPAAQAGLEVYEAIGVRLQTGRIFIPDVVVTFSLRDRTVSAVEAAQVLLAVEVVSPSTRTTDRVLKPAMYAAAGIDCYVRLERGPRPLVAVYEDPATGAYQRVRETSEDGDSIELVSPISVLLHPRLFGH